MKAAVKVKKDAKSVKGKTEDTGRDAKGRFVSVVAGGASGAAADVRKTGVKAKAGSVKTAATLKDAATKAAVEMRHTAKRATAGAKKRAAKKTAK